ncbi:MAG: HNH endonuclease [Proteobacteria bacterium]|nr:HNH endonuclease [Pseudomonadota bacterium]
MRLAREIETSFTISLVTGPARNNLPLRCVSPGYHHKRFVDAHHIQHWSAGGETSLDNLMLLCSQHHKLVHEGGFTIERDYQNHWFFRRPDGRAVPNCGYHAQDMMDDDVGDLSDLLNNPPAGGLLTVAEKIVS